jgi:hypothetical protein
MKKSRLWVKFAILYIILISIVAIFSYVTEHLLLKRPLVDVYVVTGLSIIGVTVGMVITIVIIVARIKKR